VPPRDEYANDVEVHTGENDVTIRFYRKRATGNVGGRTLIAEVTVPKSVLKTIKAAA
jgi:hypothetical protein